MGCKNGGRHHLCLRGHALKPCPIGLLVAQRCQGRQAPYSGGRMSRWQRWRLWTGVGILMAGLVQGSARVLKVLPQYLDREGRAALSPSLFDRDAYQAHLRRHPELRHSMRIQVLWRRPAGLSGDLRLRVELRGLTKEGMPVERTLEQTVATAGRRRRWTTVRLSPDTLRELGDVVAWRVTLWSGEELVGEQKSFLWER